MTRIAATPAASTSAVVECPEVVHVGLPSGSEDATERVLIAAALATRKRSV
jgi:hypothetical protein